MTCSYFSKIGIGGLFLRKINPSFWEMKKNSEMKSLKLKKKKLNKTEKQKHLLHARSYAKILLRLNFFFTLKYFEKSEHN